MRLLVVGANGLLGSNVVAAGRERGWTVSGTYHTNPGSFDIEQTQLDIRNEDHVREVCSRYDPALIVNCAAMTDVDGCEKRPERARAINEAAPGVLAACAARLDARLVHVSTDYVFDGTAQQPYGETATPNPVQTYGKSKLAGEEAVREAHDDSLIPRLSFVYGIHRSTQRLAGFPAWAAERLANGHETPLFIDQHVTPTRAGFAAERILGLAEDGVDGIINIACRECVTPYDVGRIIADERGYDVDLLTQSRMAAVDRPAARPRYSCLATDRLATVSRQGIPALASELATVL